MSWYQVVKKSKVGLGSRVVESRPDHVSGGPVTRGTDIRTEGS